MIQDIVGTVSLVQSEDGAPVALAVVDQKEGTKRCELQAAKTLLAQVPNLGNQTVTADPLHCQRGHTRRIVEKGGDYLLQIKGNHKTLYKVAQQEVQATQTRIGHGRIQAKKVTLSSTLPMATGMAYSKTIVNIQSRRTEKKTGKTSLEKHDYLSRQEAQIRGAKTVWNTEQLPVLELV